MLLMAVFEPQWQHWTAVPETVKSERHMTSKETIAKVVHFNVEPLQLWDQTQDPYKASALCPQTTKGGVWQPLDSWQKFDHL